MLPSRLPRSFHPCRRGASSTDAAINGSSVVFGPDGKDTERHGNQAASVGHEGSSQSSPQAGHGVGGQGQQPLNAPSDATSSPETTPILAMSSAASSSSSSSLASEVSPTPISSSSSSLDMTSMPLPSSTPSPTSIAPLSTLPIESSSQTSSSAVSAPTAPISATAEASRGISFYAGIALGGIAAIAVLVALFMWWLRIRKRTRCRPWEARSQADMRSNPESSDGSAAAIRTQTRWWQPLGDRDAGEPKRSNTFFNIPKAEDPFKDVRPLLTAPRPDPSTSASAFTKGPYPTVRPLPLALQNSDTTVPHVMQDLGALQLANAVTGDILTSGDETSRPATSLGGSTDVGTPRDEDFKPRYLGLDGGGLTVPWATNQGQTSKWKSRLDGGRSKDATGSAEHDSSASQLPKETWTDSLKTNIANAFSMFTTQPHLPSPPDNRYAAGWTGPSLPMYRQRTNASIVSKDWSLKDPRDGAVHDRTPSHHGWSAALRPTVRPQVLRRLPTPPGMAGSSPTANSHASLIQSKQRTQVIVRSLHDLSASSSTHDPPTGHTPPRLSQLPPSFPRMTMREFGSHHGFSRHTNASPRGSRMKSKRPFTIHRLTSSGVSAMSVGSDMSRASSSATRWSKLTDKEEAARRALRERRRKSIAPR